MATRPLAVPTPLVPLVIVFSTALSYLVAYVVSIPALVPVLNTIPAFPFMVQALRKGEVLRAIIRMLVWALALAVCATLLSYAAPQRTERLFWNAEQYRREMFEWILTGRGPEGDVRQFLPLHARHVAVFCGLALATGGLLAMPLGAVMMNYMGHYVGSLAAIAAHPASILVPGWTPWAPVRVASFVLLGVLLSGPLLSRLGHFDFQLRANLGLLLSGIGGLVLDVLLKWMLAPSWRHLLARLAGW